VTATGASFVAVIGVGAMGGRLARRLLECGHEVVVWNRTPSRATALIPHGALIAPDPAEAARRADAAITMVSDPAALRAVTEGPDGLAAGIEPRAAVIQMGTVGPVATAQLARALPDGVELVDAPALGSLAEVESGSLEIFAGGAPATVERWRPLLSDLGRVRYVGAVGAGAAAKLVANAALLETVGVLGEALALAGRLGLSREAAFEVLATTPLAAQAERRRPALEADRFPPRFALALARKDAELVVEAASTAGLDLRHAVAAAAWYRDAERGGLGDRDYSALLAWIDRAR
jgi:3-hydroxyisobutyrate dehydrogenase-like beta-hydroxyacid dehydrogenase